MTGVAVAVAAADGINKVVGLTRLVTDLVKKGANLELQEVIIDLREAVLDAKDEVLALREENQALRAQLEQKDAWSERIAAYTLVETNGGAIVWHTPGPPEHFACPACFEAGTIAVLQDVRNYGGDFRCSTCGKIYPVRPERSHHAQERPQVILRKPRP